jgi:long-chain acyl-CoA synthetase
LRLLVSKKIMAKLGGRMRLAISGGAPLSFEVARTFIGLGLTLCQGYGMTETSPIISVNKIENNDPRTVGEPIRECEIRLGDSSELLVRSAGIMLGYWNNEEATKAIIDADGWLHTGDKASITDNHITITGRIKEILVLSNGEKVPPADIEMAITKDVLFDQVMIIGEQKSFLSAITVLNKEEWQRLVRNLNLPDDEKTLNDLRVKNAILDRIKAQMKDFPGYANIYRVYNTLEPWSIENGLITPTLKLKRSAILNRYQQAANELYEGH